LGQWIVSVLRKAIFEILVILNEAIFGGLRRLIFGAINALLDSDEDIKNAIEECDLFDLLVNWLNCLLNFLQNRVLELLQKIRGEGDVGFGAIEFKLDFAFQNKQITLLRDLLKLIGKYAFKIVTICNIQNIRDDNAFVDLVADITTELGYDPYNTYQDEDGFFDSSRGLTKTMVTSVMNPTHDHSGIRNSKLRNFLRRDKGQFGLNYKNNIIVDQPLISSDNIAKRSPTSASNSPGEVPGGDVDRARQQASRVKGLSGEVSNVVLPVTLAIPKDDFVSKCNRAFTYTGGLLRNNKRLRDLLEKHDIYSEFNFSTYE